MAGLILFLFIAVIFICIFLGGVKSFNDKAVNKGKDIDVKIAEIKKEITIVNGSLIHGKKIIEVLGLVRGISDSQATTKEQFSLIEKEALYNMFKEARVLGANAITDTKLTTGTYEQQGSKWQSSQAIYTGTAVVIE